MNFKGVGFNLWNRNYLIPGSKFQPIRGRPGKFSEKTWQKSRKSKQRPVGRNGKIHSISSTFLIKKILITLSRILYVEEGTRGVCFCFYVMLCWLFLIVTRDRYFFATCTKRARIKILHITLRVKLLRSDGEIYVGKLARVKKCGMGRCPRDNFVCREKRWGSEA